MQKSGKGGFPWERPTSSATAQTEPTLSLAVFGIAMKSQEYVIIGLSFRKFGLISAAALTLATSVVSISTPAAAFGRGFYGRGWGWGGLGAGLALGALAAGAYYGPYGPYGYGYYDYPYPRPYPYRYGYRYGPWY
jgi:hypothetical protein